MEHHLIVKELELLRKENQYLKQLLANMMHRREETESSPQEQSLLHHRSSPTEKIHLFKSLFKGRTDMFAYRWESSEGRKGYTPACEFEWQKPICQKPNIKCQDCKNRKLLPLTDQVLFKHLSGEKTVGLYPLLPDNSCFFLAVDFDKQNWQQEVLTFVKTCKNANLPVYIERSRSGNGAHVWFFFSESVPAILARTLGKLLLEISMENLNTSEFDSYDRMFPNQDSMPTGGFGNLIALPLQRQSKNEGNSVFVDESFTPFQDQWLYLSSIKKISKKQIIKFIQSRNPIEIRDSQSNKIKVVIENRLKILKKEIPTTLLTEITNLATFRNPEYFKAQSRRQSTYGILKTINCNIDNVDSVILPRGCLETLKELLKKHSIEIELIDKTYDGENIEVNFKGELTSQQEDAIQTLLNHENGILAATTGFGKTVTAAALIAKRKTNTLVIVDKTQLIQQWVSSLASFLQLSPKEIGQIDVATIQSLNSNGEIKSFITQYGQIIVDECHHISAFSFEKVLKKVRAKYVHGLTATPIRKDGLHPIIFMQCGPIRYKTDAKTQAKIRPFFYTLVPRLKKFHSESTNIQEVYNAISKNDNRNQLLFDDVLKELEKGRSPIILTERVEHLVNLKNMFKGFAKNIIVLTGSMTKKELKTEMDRLLKVPDNEERLILATGRYIGEGFDDPRLDTLFLAMPISWKGTLQQYVGRLHRIHSNKSEVKVFDYVDNKIPLLKNMYEKRLSGYKSMGYVTIQDSKGNSGEQMQLF